MEKTAFYTDEVFLKHRMGDGNPESPERLEKLCELLLAAGAEKMFERFNPPKAQMTDLLAAHDPDYLYMLSHSAPTEGLHQINIDTAMNPWTWEAAQFAAGAGCDAVDRIMRGEFQKAFCAIRPPGHHAHRDHSGGFCFLNNAAIAALRALGVWDLKRVAIIDFDVHHGDGTTDILGGRQDVLIFDSFQEALYPYAHLQHCPPNAVYTPFAAGTEGLALRRAVDEVWTPKLLKWRPELLVISAGFDAHREEEQAQLLLVESDYAFIGRRLSALIEQIPECRGAVAVLEGGYQTSSLARSAAAFLTQFSNHEQA